MPRKRLFSSDEILKALIRAGCDEKKRTPGSHQSVIRVTPDGRTLTAPVPLNRKQVPRGTLDSILDLLEIEYQDFLKYAKVKRKGKARD